MHRHRLALAVLATTALLASGCGGSDDSEPASDAQQSERAEVEQPKPKPKSARAQMVGCIEDALGFNVSNEDGPHELSIKDSKGKLQAVIMIHNDAGTARKAVAKTLNRGTNAVVFGRAELIQHAAGDTETGVLANCVAAEYNRPS